MTRLRLSKRQIEQSRHFEARGGTPGHRLGWMHPSMRDLLIDHLMRHDGERTRFLDACSTEGFTLAISAAGGAEGERRFPLLRSHPDWESLEQRAQEFLRDVDVVEVTTVISALQDAAVQLEAAEHARHQDTAALHHLTSVCLRTLVTRWNDAASVIPLDQLERYAQLSLMIQPLPPMPNLLPTWKSVAPTSLDDAEEQSLNDLANWARLITIIGDTEPRFLGQVGFPQQYEPVFSALLVNLEAVPENMRSIDDPDPFEEEDPEDPEVNDYEDSEEGEADELAEVRDVLTLLHGVWPTEPLRERATALLARVEDQKDVREARSERYRAVMRRDDDEPDDDRYYGGGRQSFDIEGLFSDL